MLKKNNLITIIAAVTFSFSAYSIECKSFNTRYVDNQQTVLKSETFCVKAESSSASSKNCLFLKNKKCPFHSLTKSDKSEDFITGLGTPAFNLCHKIGGSPQIYEIKINEKWSSYNRCFAKKSQEFVDADELYAYYKTL